MRTRTGLLAAGAAVALTLGGGSALAATASIPDASGTIHGCYDGGGNVKVIDSAATCPKGYKALNWSQTGPAGAQGPQGTQGPQGPTGATGSTGAAGANGSMVLNGTGSPADSLGSNGDFYLDTAADVLYGPKASGTWPTPGTSLVGNSGPQGAQGPAGPTGPAGPGTTITEHSQFFSYNSGQNSTFTENCPSGSTLVGGYASTNDATTASLGPDPGGYISMSYPNGNGWTATGTLNFPYLNDGFSIWVWCAS